MRKRPAALALTAGLIVLGLSGCMRVQMDLALQPDNTANGTVVIAVSQSLATMAGEDPADLADEMTGDMLSGDTGDTKVEAYNQDGFVGSRITLANAPLDDLGGTTGEELAIVRDGDTFKVSGTMDLSASSMGLGDSFDMSDPTVKQFTDAFDVRISITFPGKVISHDPSSKVSGNTVTWQPKLGDTVNMEATGSAVAGGGSSLLWLWIVLGVVALAAIVVVVLVVMRRKNKPGAPAPGMDAGAYPSYQGDVPPMGTPDAAGAYPPQPPAGPSYDTSGQPAQPPAAPYGEQPPAAPYGQQPFAGPYDAQPPAAPQPPASPYGQPPTGTPDDVPPQPPAAPQQ